MIGAHESVPDLSPARVIGLHSRWRSGAEAIVHPKETVTFRDLWQRATEVASDLAAAGSGPRDRVAIALEPGADYVATVLGTLLIGATAVPMNTRLTADEAAAFLHPVAPGLAVASEQHLPMLGRLGCSGARSLQSVEGLAVAMRVEADPSAGESGELPALVLGTGGTTGTPKGALFSHQALWRWIMAAAAHNNVRSSDTELFVAPFYHGTLVTGLLTTLAMGGRVVIEDGFDEERVVRHIGSGTVTRLLGASTVVNRILEAAQDADMSRCRLRLLQFGMGASRPGFAGEIQAVFPSAAVVTGYGATEFGPVTRTYSWEFDDHGEPIGVGRPVAGVDMTIELDGELRDESGIQGEILVSSPWQMGRYVVADDSVEEQARRGHYIRSGDIGCFDKDGFLILTGRSKETIRTGGENVYPAEVEAVLHRCAGVAECAVYGVSDVEWGERVEAAAVLAPGAGPVDLAELDRHLRGHLAGYKIPKQIRVVDRLPLTSNFKVDRRLLRSLAEGEEARS